MKLKSVLLTFGLVFLLSATSVAAEEIAKEKEYIPPTAEQKEIERLLIQADIEARNEVNKKPVDFGIDTLASKINYENEVLLVMDKKLEKHGIKRVSDLLPSDEGSNVSVLSLSPPKSDIQIKKPTVYSSSQGYVIKGSYHWIYDSKRGVSPWYDHRSIGGNAVGGADGIGMSFTSHSNFSVTSASFYTVDNFNNAHFTGSNALHPYLNSDNGVYFGAQDRIRYTLEVPYYNFHNVYLTVWPNIKGKFNVNARTHLTHTWSSGRFTVSSVSSTGIFSFGITSSDKTYQGYSDTTYVTN